MNPILSLLLILPLAIGQFIGFGQGYSLRNRGYGGFIDGGFYGNRGSFYYGAERSYYVKGRLLCGIQTQAARVTLWENRGGGQPYVYDETMTDMTGYFRVKAEIRGGGVGVVGGGYGSLGGWNGFSNGNIMLTINHNCDGQRQLSVDLPPSYWNQGISSLRTFDLGTLNLEAIFYGEEMNRLSRGPHERYIRFGEMVLCPSN